MSTFQDHIKVPEIWIVFSGQTDMSWLNILKPGFRHCYALINDGERWISYDPLAHFTDVSVHQVPSEFNLPLWMKDRGHKVLRAPVNRIQKEAPWMIFTCVEAVKRVIGLHNRWILTPWQLYRHLQKQEQYA